MRMLTAAFTLCLVTPAFADLVVNGSFETDTVSNGSYATLTTASTLTGWTVDVDDVELIEGYWTAYAGSKSLDLSGNNPGQISQVFTTTAGASYRLTFMMSANPDGGSTVRTMDVTFDGVTQSASYDTSVFNPTTSNMNWQFNVMTFTATGTTTTLTFTSTENSAFGPALDDVQLNEIPEPASLLLFGLGLGGLGLWRRAQKKKAAKKA
jgi:choice-of-anchor C domain-containing protein